MKKLFAAGIIIACCLVPTACGKIYNSSSYDASTYGTAGGTAQFLAAKTVLNTHCTTCHTRPSHQAWAGMSQQDFVDQGLVVGGSLTGSTLYTKIQGNRTGVPGNMPDGGTLLTTDELIVMETWIQSF